MFGSTYTPLNNVGRTHPPDFPPAAFPYIPEEGGLRAIYRRSCWAKLAPLTNNHRCDDLFPLSTLIVSGRTFSAAHVGFEGAARHQVVLLPCHVLSLLCEATAVVGDI